MLVETASRGPRKKMYETQKPMTAAASAETHGFTPSNINAVRDAANTPIRTREKTIQLLRGFTEPV